MAKNITKMGGNNVTLIGKNLKTGVKAPDFLVLGNNLETKTLKDFSGKIKIISVVPSIDTSVCDLQTKRFNKIAGEISDKIIILTISMDLPFAQKRWCGTAGVDKVTTLSDHKLASFGKNYGVLIKEHRLLNRSVFLIDENDIIRYIEIVQENHNHPDYDRLIGFIKNFK